MAALAHSNSALLALSALPPFPPVAAKLMRLLRQQHTDFRDVVGLMKTDAGITSEVLRLANTASGGARFPTTSLLQALSVLGVNRIVSLATTLCVGRMLQPVAQLPVMRRCWRHNLATAFIASNISQECRLDTEKAYTFGLLSGIGRMALLVSNPKLFAQAVSRAERERRPLAALEHELYGFDYREAGSWVVESWDLPAELDQVLFAGVPHDGQARQLAEIICQASDEADRLGLGVTEFQPSECSTLDQSFFEIVERINQVEQDLGM